MHLKVTCSAIRVFSACPISYATMRLRVLALARDLLHRLFDLLYMLQSVPGVI